MARPRGGNRRRFVLALVVLTSLTLITLDTRGGRSGPLGSVGRIAHTIVSPDRACDQRRGPPDRRLVERRGRFRLAEAEEPGAPGPDRQARRGAARRRGRARAERRAQAVAGPELPERRASGPRSGRRSRPGKLRVDVHHRSRAGVGDTKGHGGGRARRRGRARDRLVARRRQGSRSHRSRLRDCGAHDEACRLPASRRANRAAASSSSPTSKRARRCARVTQVVTADLSNSVFPPDLPVGTRHERRRETRGSRTRRSYRPVRRLRCTRVRRGVALGSGCRSGGSADDLDDHDHHDHFGSQRRVDLDHRLPRARREPAADARRSRLGAPRGDGGLAGRPVPAPPPGRTRSGSRSPRGGRGRVRSRPGGGRARRASSPVSDIDLFLETPLGLSALAYALTAFTVGVLQGGVLRDAEMVHAGDRLRRAVSPAGCCSSASVCWPASRPCTAIRRSPRSPSPRSTTRCSRRSCSSRSAPCCGIRATASRDGPGADSQAFRLPTWSWERS